MERIGLCFSTGSMRIVPTGRERFFGEEEIIVSKTDPQGRIRYANDVFLRVAGYREAEVIGQPHSLIRHPDMPRSVFAHMWRTLESGQEIFAYVVNLAKDGDHYWVFAHVTPTFGAGGEIVGYHSSRRCPERRSVEAIERLYRSMVETERRHQGKADQIAAGTELLQSTLGSRGVAYDELMFSL